MLRRAGRERESDTAAYFDDEDLPHFGEMGDHARARWKRFMIYDAGAFEAGELTKREKLLIGFAVAITMAHGLVTKKVDDKLGM
ncbi:MAG: hypothetical protein U0324_42765 [Polyangiales bacterium]